MPLLSLENHIYMYLILSFYTLKINTFDFANGANGLILVENVRLD